MTNETWVRFPIDIQTDATLPQGLVRVVDPRTGLTSGYTWIGPPPLDAKFQERVDRFTQLLRQANS